MRQLTLNEVEKVNGGFLVSAAWVAYGAYRAYKTYKYVRYAANLAATYEAGYQYGELRGN
ncbi:MAG: hypothetical protein ACSHW0_03525 [Thalassotalea sp.]